MDPWNPMQSSDAGYDLCLPFPPGPLKDHLLLPVETMVQQMEAMLRAAKLGPEFEAKRLKSKNPERFCM
jgi:hypothetical protein